MSSLITTLLIAGIALYAFIHRCDLLGICGNNITDIINSGGGGTSIPSSSIPSTTGGGGSGGATAVAGKMIYKGTGKVLTGDLAVKEAKENWGLDSGGSRPSTRFIWGSGKGKGAAKCVTFNSYEATVYATFGRGGKPAPNTRYILTGGGGGQRGNNCCVYSVGFITSSGESFAEEEGAHDPHPTIEKMPVVGGAIKNIGPLAGRTIGLKEVLIRKPGQVLLEGWVDKAANGNWELFYRAINPHGGNLPVITRTGLVGEQCGEVRMRCDGIWPVDIDISRSSVAELPDNATSGGGGNVSAAPIVPPTSSAATPAVTNNKNKNLKKAKANIVYMNSSRFTRVAI